MKPASILACACLLAVSAVYAQQSTPPTPHPNEFEMPDPALTNDYPLTEDSKPQPGVPRGTTFTFPMSPSEHPSKVFPGTTRTISVYIPAAYTGNDPACVFVLLDSLSYNVQTVFDNLIAQHAMPVTIAIGVSPGTVASSDPNNDPRYDRSMEFDTRTGRLASFLLDEVFPAVEQHGAPDGRPIHLSHNPNDHGIGGGSTGGIGAFTAAWERPDAFHRVFSSIGTYVGMRGGEQDYVIVRKTEPKPIRIFMQDGIHDEWGGGPEIGDWWMSNLTMQRALDFAGYDVRHVFGLGNHNGSQAAQLFPEAMRWLWQGWPAPIVARPPGNPTFKAILNPAETWQPAVQGCTHTLYLAADPHGAVSVATSSGKVVALSPGSPCPDIASVPLAFGAQGKFYAAHSEPGANTQFTDTALTVRSNGDIYSTAGNGDNHGELWLTHAGGARVRLAAGIQGASGLALSPDGLWLFVAQRNSHLALSFQVLPDGTVANPEPLFDLEVPANADTSGAMSVAMDREGRAYVATLMGVQVMDHNGRTIGILPLPGNQPATSLCFGGEGFSTLYVASGTTVFTRVMKVPGVPPAAPPIKVPNWGAG